MLQRMSVALALVLSPGLAFSQDVIKDFRPADFEQFIRETLKKDYAKEQTKAGFQYDIKDTPYFAMINPGGKFLLFFVRAGTQGITLEKLNAWNRDAIFSRVYLSGNSMIFEVPLGFAAGTTHPILKAYYDGFQREFEGFKKAMQAN